MNTLSTLINSYSLLNEQEASIKFDKDFIENIQNLLLNSNITYQELSRQYNISTGRISEINTGKIWKNNNYIYPLRNTHKKHNYCIDCGTEIQIRSTRCNSCEQKNRNKNSKFYSITREELKELIRTKPFTQIGKQFKISDNAIKKWCDKFDLPRTKREINSYTDEEWTKI